MKYLLTLTLLAGLVLNVAASPVASDRGDARDAQRGRLQQVHKIYVGDMGTNDEAERFRLLLEEALTKRGFTVVSRAEDSDAVLTGALSVRVLDRATEARVYVRLETRGGERLWAKDFGHKRLRANPFDRTEPTKRRAGDVAKGLREDWEGSG
ncbi:MAG TPA: hypothetical protein VER76_07660, partial [Pyrinomonadaceae bacterium]|nr:hypothetical protein [Pyrinomonadaceae bacterium]